MKYRDNRSVSVFAFICKYISEHGFPPTMGEIAKDQGFSSNAGVLRHLDKLEKWGWIERNHGHARSIRTLRPCPGTVIAESSSLSRRYVLPR